MEIVREKNTFADEKNKLLSKDNTRSFLMNSLIIISVISSAYFIGVRNYVLFHTFIELFGIFIGIGVTIIAYNSASLSKNGHFLYIGVSFLFISLFQLIHVFSFEGINVFTWNDYNISIQISLVTKFLDVFSLFSLLFIPHDTLRKNLNVKIILIPYLILSVLIVTSIYFKVFPRCIQNGVEPTRFKVISEYTLLCLYGLILILLSLRRRLVDSNVFNFIFSYIAIKLIAEILFISYAQVNDSVNALAHILRFIAYYIIYKVFVLASLKKPIAILFGKLERTNRELEQKTIELERTNAQLKNEILDCIRVEDLLRKSEEKYRLLVEFIPDAVFVHDRKNIIFANQAGARLFDFKNPEEFANRTVKSFLGEGNYDLYLKRIDEIHKSSKYPYAFEYKMLNGRGESIYAEVITTLYPVEDKRAYLSVVRDITQRKQVEELRRSVDENTRLLKEAAEMDKMKTDYYTNLSHEFRTPLSVMLCTLQIMESHCKEESRSILDKEKIVRYIASMKHNSYRLLKTVNNLLEIAKIEFGNDDLRLRNHNIVNIVERVTMSVWEYTRNRRISLMFDTDEEVITTACDMDKVERIILNLLSNAIKFTKEGGQIEVNVYDGHSHVVIVVKDNGIGIPEDKIDLIFERFKQVNSSLTRDHEGTGIGLSLVKALVEMHDGKIEVESRLCEGSTFRVILPVRILPDGTSLYNGEIEDELKNCTSERINIELSDL